MITNTRIYIQTGVCIPFLHSRVMELHGKKIGIIVCANCHLANKTVDIMVPKALLPNTVVGATVRVSYDLKLKQVLKNEH